MISTATLRAIALGAGLGFVMAIVPSCGPSKPTTLPDGGMIAKCNRNTCSGCCDESGSCFTGASPEACGLDGVTCQVCKLGQSCSKTGVCSSGAGGGSGGGSAGGGSGGGSAGGGSGGGSAGGGSGGGSAGGGSGGGAAGGGTGGGVAACSNVNCPNGCCDPVNGSCRVGTADNACGAGGLACKVCNVGMGQSCQNNACVGGTCDATSCPTGCCSGMTCVTPPNANQCGIAGASCVTCPGASPTCDVDAGVCVGGAGGGAGGSGGAGGFGGFGGTGGFGGFGGGSISLPCSPACSTGQCCDFGFICVNANASCLLTSILTPGATCNGTSGMCQ